MKHWRPHETSFPAGPHQGSQAQRFFAGKLFCCHVERLPFLFDVPARDRASATRREFRLRPLWIHARKIFSAFVGLTSVITHYHQLHMNTRIKVERGLRLASLGEKDRARDIARFVRNSCIIEILKPYSGQLQMDAYLLETHLRDLERKCHPLSPALTDLDKFSQVLSRLDLIAGLLNSNWGNLQRNVSQGGGVSNLENGGDAVREKTNLISAPFSPNFSVSVAQRSGGVSSGLRLSSKDSRREFPAENSSNGRDGERTKSTTLRLRVVGLKSQAKKEEV